MKARKVLTLVLSLVLVVALSVVGTVAYLTSDDTVTNTFSVGKIAITLDEAKTDEYGEKVPNAARVEANRYLLVPGHTYTKDPVVHVKSDSEAAYLFVQITNGIVDIEADNNEIAEQILTNGWTALKGVEGVYWKMHAKPEEGEEPPEYIDYDVFESFTVDGEVDGEKLAEYENATVVVQAFAIQSMEIEDEAAAWAALQG
ncbi:MAG: hypothetical protein E7442_06310 [Ruminococcaceae bacterium]|nr:hypothetical protein [Oscillospiraceae bacterium]